MPPQASSEARGVPWRWCRTTNRAASTITRAIRGISSSSADRSPSLGTRNATLTSPRANPLPKTRQTYTSAPWRLRMVGTLKEHVLLDSWALCRSTPPAGWTTLGLDLPEGLTAGVDLLAGRAGHHCSTAARSGDAGRGCPQQWPARAPRHSEHHHERLSAWEAQRSEGWRSGSLVKDQKEADQNGKVSGGR